MLPWRLKTITTEANLQDLKTELDEEACCTLHMHGYIFMNISPVKLLYNMLMVGFVFKYTQFNIPLQPCLPRLSKCGW